MFLKPKSPKRFFRSCIFACFSAKAKGLSSYSDVEGDLVDEYFVRKNHNLQMVSLVRSIMMKSCNKFNLRS